MKCTEKKVLIISHNPLSSVNNNGKTLTSIFDGVQKNNIYQIYLNGEIPDYSDECNYLQINEKQIISSVLHLKNLCCKEIKATPGNVSATRIKKGNFANHLKRLLRELVWKFSFWKPKLKKWLEGKNFDVVFFMAGDGMFAYDIYRFVMKNISAKGCLFFTDDYIIGKTSRSPVALLRQSLLKRKMKKTLPIVKEMYVISDEMKKAYGHIFNMDSYVIRNFSVEKSAKLEKKQFDLSKRKLTMVYAGGLHYNRWRVLADIAEALKSINQKSTTQCCLKIYSAQNLDIEIIEKLNTEGASEFCGGVSADKISEIYSESDILLHVESFDKKSIASTKYSFSTKIPEYLSAGKCIFAVGPSEVASIKYLSAFACVADENNALSEVLENLVNNGEFRQSIVLECEKYYEKDFSRDEQGRCLQRILNN